MTSECKHKWVRKMGGTLCLRCATFKDLKNVILDDEDEFDDPRYNTELIYDGCD